MNNNDVVIVSAARTPVGAFNGAYVTVSASELGRTAIAGALHRAGISGNDVDEVIMGQVLTAGQGQNPARQAGMAAGIRQEAPAMTVNQVCGSGLRAVALAYQSVLTGAAKIVVAGGQENMSQSPHAVLMRPGVKMGPATMVDTMIQDGLWDSFNDFHMGQTAENLAEKYAISRDEQDVFATASQNKAEAARAQGRFCDEIVPVTVKGRKGDIVVEQDEYIRDGVSIADLQKLRPAFRRDGGTVTAGNASGLNDGAAALVVMSAEEAAARGLTPLARIASWAHAGVDPAFMGIGPVPASQAALQKAGWSLEELDLIEANEAFAAQALSVSKALGLDAEKVNVNGGAIAIGHPIGASGARVLTTLLFEMKRRSVQKGLATLCIGGGMGIAMCIERFSDAAK